MLKIALLEDNLHFRRGLEQIVSDMPGTTLLASYSNAESALHQISQISPDIYIVDINLPGISGIDFIRQAKELLPRTEFLVCTIHDDNSTIFESLKSGATGYLLKEASANEIKAAIVEIAAGGSPMSTYISRRVISTFNNVPKRTSAAAYNLTDREMEILDLLSQGLLYKEMAIKLAISSDTVKKHIRNIYGKLQVQNKIEALNKLRG